MRAVIALSLLESSVAQAGTLDDIKASLSTQYMVGNWTINAELIAPRVAFSKGLMTVELGKQKVNKSPHPLGRSYVSVGWKWEFLPPSWDFSLTVLAQES